MLLFEGENRVGQVPTTYTLNGEVTEGSNIILQWNTEEVAAKILRLTGRCFLILTFLNVAYFANCVFGTYVCLVINNLQPDL